MVSLPPPLLRCFRSGGSRSEGNPPGAPEPIRPEQEALFRIPGSKAACAYPPGLSQLATPFLGARAEPSTGWLAGAGGSLVKVSTTPPIPLNNPSPPEEVIRPQVPPLRPPCYDFAPPSGAPPNSSSPPPPQGVTLERRGLVGGSLGWRDGRCVQGAGTYSPRVGDTRLLGIPRSRGRVAALDPYWGGVYGIAFPPFRGGRIPLSPPPLQLACSPPGVSGAY